MKSSKNVTILHLHLQLILLQSQTKNSVFVTLSKRGRKTVTKNRIYIHIYGAEERFTREP